MTERERYCEPLECGLASATPSVARRLARLVEALDNEITGHVVRGKVAEDVRRFKLALWSRLERDGWVLTYDGGDRLRVYPPGSPTGARKRADMLRRLGGGA